MKRTSLLVLAAVVAGSALLAAGSGPGGRVIGVNIVLKSPVSDGILAELGEYGKVRDVIPEINGVTVQAPESALEAIRQLPYVEAAGPDAERTGAPIDTATEIQSILPCSTQSLHAPRPCALRACSVSSAYAQTSHRGLRSRSHAPPPSTSEVAHDAGRPWRPRVTSRTSRSRS